MFALEVRDHIMIAHSFKGEIFGPAQAMHGATFVVDACLFADDLDDHALLVDIGAFADALKAILAPLNYSNLDDLPEFSGQNTTTEFLARHIHGKLATQARAGALGRPGDELKRLRVTLGESHVARAWFEADL
jgi:6-pyruvoyl-tetrahydropterin synthase